MYTVTSRDGTTIAYDRMGDGPPLILVGGAFEQRAANFETARLAALPLLTEQFTLYHYDRRGRGDSTDTLPYTLEREIEDIAALIDEAGEPAFLFGISSGAALALEAALSLGDRIRKVVLYEPPYTVDEDGRQRWQRYRLELDKMLEDDLRDDAVAHFMMLVGATPEDVDEARRYPVWPMFASIAPTLAYDAAAIGDGPVPVKRAARLTVPALVVTGSETFPFMQVSADTLASALPHGRRLTLEGQTHEVAAEALAPVLVDFFNSGGVA